MEAKLPHHIGIAPALQHFFLLGGKAAGAPLFKFRFARECPEWIEMTDTVGGKFPHLRLAFLLHQRKEAGKVPGHELNLEGRPGCGEGCGFVEQLLGCVVAPQMKRRLQRGVKAVIVRRCRQFGLPRGIDSVQPGLIQCRAADSIAAKPSRAEAM